MQFSLTILYLPSSPLLRNTTTTGERECALFMWARNLMQSIRVEFLVRISYLNLKRTNTSEYFGHTLVIS